MVGDKSKVEVLVDVLSDPNLSPFGKVVVVLGGLTVLCVVLYVAVKFAAMISVAQLGHTFVESSMVIWREGLICGAVVGAAFKLTNFTARGLSKAMFRQSSFA